MGDPATLDSREWSRKSVNRDAMMTFGNCVVHGIIKDISANGLFFTPEYGMIDGDFVQGEDCLDNLDDQATIHINGSHINGLIKWIGHQITYKCKGVGVQFTMN